MLSATVPCAVWFNINNPQDKLALGSKIKPGNRTGTCSSNQRNTRVFMHKITRGLTRDRCM